ncbi:cache domain-containing protein [Gulosibacter sp. ACHW.36C]|uniref:Cache domain-containing protein n=1 Tax=Gulosibacter sediminis TaxID=1729695 RepID=A0ABY4MX91_9MICO|nr:cache domain-containing protein [Gulosibacter sediminis]UQN14335.1 cache domain-containing protein [Gulosibacter sediminis]
MTTPAAAVTEIADWFEGYFVDIERLRDEITAELASVFTDARPVVISPPVSERIRQISVAFLERHPRSDGAGIVFELAQLDPAKARLEWWLRDGEKFQRNNFILDPSSERFYDFEKLDWFRGGFHHESRTIAGPYIDHLGVDYYISTLTVPAFVGERKVGIVGSDVRMDDLERVLIPMLAPLPRGAAVLSRHNQVLVGNSGEFSTGVLVAAVPQRFSCVSIPTPGLGLRLLYRD